MTVWEISQTAQDNKQLKIPTGHISPFALLFKWRKKTNKQRNHSQSKRWNLPRGEVTTWSGVLENNQNKKQKQNPLNNNNSHCVWTLFPRLETVIKVKGEKLSSVDDHHADIPHKAADYSNTQHTKLFFFCFFFFLKNGDDVIKALMHHPQVYNKCGPCAELQNIIRHVSSFSLSIDMCDRPAYSPIILLKEDPTHIDEKSKPRTRRFLYLFFASSWKKLIGRGRQGLQRNKISTRN